MALILTEKPGVDYVPIHKALMGGKASARLVHGGKLTEEYARNSRVRRIVVALERAGRARICPAAAIEAVAASIQALKKCRSNDSHILGLAIVSGARLLCTQDGKLAVDFRNKDLVPTPRGNVYKRKCHARLLGKHCQKVRAQGT